MTNPAINFYIERVNQEILEEQPSPDGYYRSFLGVQGGQRSGETLRFTQVRISKDDPSLRDKLVMCRMAKDLLTQALTIDGYDPAIAYAVQSAVQGWPHAFHTIGALFENYGAFQQKFAVFKTKETKDLLADKLRGRPDNEWYEGYVDGRKSGQKPERVPLPFAVRNVLAHRDHSNRVKHAEVQRATQILARLMQQSA